MARSRTSSASCARQGFFEGGGDGLVADVYLGYGLSRALRRTDGARPAGAVPAAAGRGRGSGARTSRSAGRARSAIGEWERTWDEAAYARGRRGACATAIAAGDVYQVNLVQHLSAPFRGDPAGLAAALAPLRPLEPRPLVGDGWAVVSASPELFLARRGRRVWTKPIKGTRPLGETTSWPSRRRTPPST